MINYLNTLDHLISVEHFLYLQPAEGLRHGCQLFRTKTDMLCCNKDWKCLQFVFFSPCLCHPKYVE